MNKGRTKEGWEKIKTKLCIIWRSRQPSVGTVLELIFQHGNFQHEIAAIKRFLLCLSEFKSYHKCSFSIFAANWLWIYMLSGSNEAGYGKGDEKWFWRGSQKTETGEQSTQSFLAKEQVGKESFCNFTINWTLFVSLGLGQFNSKMIQQDFQAEAERFFPSFHFWF